MVEKKDDNDEFDGDDDDEKSIFTFSQQSRIYNR